MPSISTFLVRDVQINSLKFIATVGTGLFAGVALGVSVVDVPTRRELEPEAALKQWCGMFNRAKLLQAPITLVSGLASLAVGYLKKDPIWYLGGSVMLGMGPFTQFAIMPTNKKLLNSETDPNADSTRKLIEYWAKLHLVRTVASCAVFGLLVWRQL